MEPLNLPGYKFKLGRNPENQTTIFDVYRKKHLVLTPEEWVRQHILRFLVEEKNVPEGLISSEAGLKVNQLKRRYDALLYDRNGTALMLIECKAPKVAINQKAFDQVLAYNQTIKATYILVTNGMKHYCCKLAPDTHLFEFLNDIPDFETM